MKFRLAPAVVGVIISLAGSVLAHDNRLDDKNEIKTSGKVERSIPVTPEASITLCVMSGKLVVRGWEKNEVRVRSTDVDQIDFRRLDKTKDYSVPASRVDVMIVDRQSSRGDCQALADVEMDVPKEATVQVQTRDGDIEISGIAGVYAGSQNGDIAIERASRFVEAGSIGGSIGLKDSSGRINLSSAGGGVEVSNVKPAEADDTFEVGTVSGDIQLNHVSNGKLSAKTVNGDVMMTGPLTRTGYYSFTTMGGDVILVMPSDASFSLNARVSEKADIVSDFPLKYVPEPPPPMPTPKPAPEAAPKSPKGETGNKTGPIIAPLVVVKPIVVNPFRRINAICGSGDAKITLSSFGGTLHLKKM